MQASAAMTEVRSSALTLADRVIELIRFRARDILITASDYMSWCWGIMLTQRPITLVLIMSNSCNYSTDDLVLIYFQIFNQDLSRF